MSTFNNLSFSWPNGTACLLEISGTLSAPRTCLSGDNGSSKSTLHKLMLGTYSPTSGSIEVTDNIGYLPQDLGLKTSATIADIFGVTETLDAIEKVEAGEYSEELLDRKSTRLNSSHVAISYAVFCLKKNT